MRQGLDALRSDLLKAQAVEVFIADVVDFQLAVDTVEARGDNRRADQIRIATGVRQAKFQATVGHPHHRRTVVGAERYKGWRPGRAGQRVAHHQTLVGVDRRCGESAERRTMGKQAGGEVIGHFRQPHAARVAGIKEQVLVLGAADRQVKVHAVAGAFRVRLGHERADHAQVIGDLAGGHAKERESIRRGHGVAVGVIDLELAIGVFVVDLIDLEIHRLQRLGQAFEEHPGARQAFVVVARLVQVVAGIDQLQFALLVTAHQVELGLQAGVERPALVFQATNLLLQHVTAVIRMRLAVDMTDAHDPAITRLPGHRHQRGQIATGHEVRTVGFHAHATDGESGKTCAVLGHGLESTDRHRFGFGRTMDIDKLRKHILDPVLVDDALGFCWQHCSSLLAKKGKSLGMGVTFL